MDALHKLADGDHVEVAYSKPDTLLKKFDIPVGHLDFVYVEKCNNVRELEKILQILQSGEEGYFPDLMRKTEEKLAQVKPNSRHLRKATPVLEFSSLDKQSKEELVYDLDAWRHEVEQQNTELNQHKKITMVTHHLPHVRKGCEDNVENSCSKETRIQATDYASWDKYDPDTEILKMDLETERMCKEFADKVKISEKPKKSQKNVQINDFITTTEATIEANYERAKGNEYYRSKDTEQAVLCYSNSIRYQPSLANYNNRAQALIKLKKYEEAAEDCRAALQFDPDNIKANLRLVKCLECLHKYPEAMQLAIKVIQLDPNNTVAQNYINKISINLMPRSLPKTRMKIVEISESDDMSTESAAEQVLLPIPGSSKMPEPFYIIMDSKNPEFVRQQEYIINNRPHAMFGTTIEEDDVDCVINHQKSVPTNKCVSTDEIQHNIVGSQSNQDSCIIANETNITTSIVFGSTTNSCMESEHNNEQDMEPFQDHSERISEAPDLFLDMPSLEFVTFIPVLPGEPIDGNTERCVISNGTDIASSNTQHNEAGMERVDEYSKNRRPAQDHPEHESAKRHKLKIALEYVDRPALTDSTELPAHQQQVVYMSESESSLSNDQEQNEDGASDEMNWWSDSDDMDSNVLEPTVQLYVLESDEENNNGQESIENNVEDASNENHNMMLREERNPGGEPHVNAMENLDEPSLIQLWLDARNDPLFEQQADLLRRVEVQRLLEVLGSESGLFAEILNTLFLHFMVPQEVQRVHDMLTHFAEMPRFPTAVVFLTLDDYNTMHHLFDFLEEHGMPLTASVRRRFTFNL